MQHCPSQASHPWLPALKPSSHQPSPAPPRLEVRRDTAEPASAARSTEQQRRWFEAHSPAELGVGSVLFWNRKSCLVDVVDAAHGQDWERSSVELRTAGLCHIVDLDCIVARRRTGRLH